MNRIIKKLAVGLLVLAAAVSLLPGTALVSYAATGKITFSDPSVTVGNQVSVTMKIASSDGTGLGASDVMLEYDSSALEFVSGTNANGGAGSIRVVGSMEAANQTTFSFTLKFKALKAGSTAVTVKSQEVYDADSQAVTLSHVGSSTVKVNAPATYSTNASLASLTISPGELSPAFSADVTEYTATVSADVEKITVSAPAADSKASVVVNGNEGLQMGENTVVCKVTAEDGTTTKSYTITVTKTENAETSPEGGESVPAGTPGQVGGSVVNVEEGNWQAAETFDAELLPDGFTVTEYEYNGVQVQAGVDANGVILLYMTDENGNSDFFYYDAANGILAPYVTVRMAEKTIVVLPPEQIPEGTELPTGFVKCTIDIGSHTVYGWIWDSGDDTAPESCMVYGMNADGERNFYRYDQKEMTLQRYFPDPEAESLRAKYYSLGEDYNGLIQDYETRGYIIAGLFGACILLVIILIVLLLTRKPRNPYDGGKERYQEPYEQKEKSSVRREPARTQAKKTRTPARRRTEEFSDDDWEIEDLDEEELPEPEPAPVRRTAPAKSGQPKPAAKKPVKQAPKSVADVERDIAATLAKEASEAAVQEKTAAEESDDDFEFIDLDL